MTEKYRRLSAVDYPGLWEELRRWCRKRDLVPLNRLDFAEFMFDYSGVPVKIELYDTLGDFRIREDDVVWFTLRWS